MYYLFKLVDPKPRVKTENRPSILMKGVKMKSRPINEKYAAH